MDSGKIRSIALQVGVVASVFLYYRLHWLTLQNYVEAMDHCERLFCDFFKVFYVMGETIFTDKVPYKGFYYSPFAAIIFNVWGRLPRMESLQVWGLAQAAAVIGLYVCWLPAMQKERSSFKLLYLFLLLTSFPLLHNFKWGQVSVFLTLAVFLSALAYRLNYRIFAAFWLAFAVSIKFYPAIFLLYFIFQRDIKFLAAFTLFAFMMAFVIPVAAIGFEATVDFYVTIFTSAEARFVAGGGGALNSQNFAYVMLRLLNMEPGGLWTRVFQIAGFLVLALNIALAFLVSLSDLEDRETWAFLLLFASMPFFIPTSWPHYFVYLPAFQAAAVFMFSHRSGMIMNGLKIFSLGLSILLSNVIFFNLVDDRQVYARLSFLFWSNLLLLLAAYMELTPRLKFKDPGALWERLRAPGGG